jgi:hypothetical protein
MISISCDIIVPSPARIDLARTGVKFAAFSRISRDPTPTEQESRVGAARIRSGPVCRPDGVIQTRSFIFSDASRGTPDVELRRAHSVRPGSVGYRCVRSTADRRFPVSVSATPADPSRRMPLGGTELVRRPKPWRSWATHSPLPCGIPSTWATTETPVEPLLHRQRVAFVARGNGERYRRGGARSGRRGRQPGTDDTTELKASPEPV